MWVDVLVGVPVKNRVSVTVFEGVSVMVAVAVKVSV